MNTVQYEINKNVKKRKRRIIFIVMILLCTITFLLIFKTDLFTVKYVEIYKNHKISKKEILKQSGIILGNHIFKEKLEDIQYNICQNSYIKDVKVERKFPDTIKIYVVERTEMAGIPFMDRFLIIDEEGVVLKSEKNNKNLKIIQGLKFHDFIEGEVLNVQDKEQLQRALEVIKGLEQYDIMIKELNVADKENIVINFTEHLKGMLGKGNDLNYKLLVLKKILEDIASKNITRGIVDISHEGAPSYRPVE